MASVVSIQIQIDDGDSAAVISRIEQAIASLGTTGDGSLKQVSTSADATTASLQQSAEAASTADAGMVQLSTTLAKVASGYDQVGNSATAAAQRSVRASAEMQQMLDNIERAEQRQGGRNGANFTNVLHGPTTAIGESFAGIGTAEQEMEQLGMSFAQMPAKVKPAEDAIQRFGRSAGGHTTTSLDNVRLLSQEFGIRLPRAMENALARMPALAAGLGSFSAGLLAIGGVEVFAHMGEEVYDLEQKFISIDKPMSDFYDKLKKTSELDFSNTRQLATTNFRQGQVELTAQTAPDIAKGLQRSGLASMFGGTAGFGAGIGDLFAAHDAAQQGATASQQNIELQRKQLDQTHEAALAQIELNHALDSTLSRRQQIAAEQQKAADVARETRNYGTKVEEFYGNRAPGNAGAAEQTQANARAQAEAAAKTIQLNNEVSAAVMKARDTATQAGLQGEALYQAKQRDGVRELIAELQAQHMAEEIPERVRALNEQYDNERLARVRALTEETRKQTAESEAAGLKGVPRADAELRAQLGNIDAAENKFRVNGQVAPDVAAQFDQQRVNARTASNAKIGEIEAEFTQRMGQMVDERAEQEMGGFARITAAAQREKDAIAKTFSDSFGSDGSGANDNDRAARDASSAAVDKSADAQRQQLRAKNAADDLQFDREAAQAEARVREQGIMGWVASYRDGIAEIQAQEAQRAARLSEDLQKGEIEWSDYERRKADIEAGANAEIQAQNQHLQQQIAGQLQQAFTNPVEYIKSALEKMFFEILAGWIMRLDTFKSLFGTTMAGMQPGAAGASGGAGGVGGMLGHALGLGGALRGAGGAPAGTAGVISSGTSIASEYTSIPAVGGGGWSSTASAAAVPARAGGTPVEYGGWGGAAVPSSTTSVGGGVASPDSTVPFADNGEGGGFAGYLTGNTDDMSIAAAADDDSISSQATQQATAMQSVGGGPGLLAGAAGDAALAYGAYQGGKGVYDSFFEGGSKGAMDGTMSGVEAGASVGTMVLPGVGTLIGGAIGGIAGLATNLVGQIMGEPGRMAARNYYRQTLFPELEGIKKTFENGSGEDYMSAISQANSASASGLTYMKAKFGSDAAGWVNDNYLKKEVTEVTTTIQNEAAGGKQYMTRAAAEFHSGGTITSFHDFATSPTEGFIHAKLGEGVVNDTAMQSHGPHVAAINSGANALQMASMYLQSAGGARAAAPLSGGDTHHHTWSTLDGPSTEGWLKRGGADRIATALNNRQGSYSGDSGYGG